MIETSRFREDDVEDIHPPVTETVDKVKEKVDRAKEVKKYTHTVKTLTSGSPELTPGIVQEISEFFRYTFNNAFPEYLICTSCDIQCSAPTVFGTGKEYVDLKTMDDMADCFYCPGCYEKMELFHDSGMVQQKIQKNLSENACVSLLKNDKNDLLAGMTFAYFDTFEQVFQREWSNEKIYMQNQDIRFNRDMNWFLEKINKTLREQQKEEIHKNTEVCCWNCASIHPKSQGLNNMLQLFQGLFDVMYQQQKEDLKNKFVVLETRMNSTGHKIMKIAGAIDVKNVFGDKEQVFMVGSLTNMIQRLNLSFTEIVNIHRQQKNI